METESVARSVEMSAVIFFFLTCCYFERKEMVLLWETQILSGQKCQGLITLLRWLPCCIVFVRSLLQTWFTAFSYGQKQHAWCFNVMQRHVYIDQIVPTWHTGFFFLLFFCFYFTLTLTSYHILSPVSALKITSHEMWVAFHFHSQAMEAIPRSLLLIIHVSVMCAAVPSIRQEGGEDWIDL